jgi:glucose 1-dehydrogenase
MCLKACSESASRPILVKADVSNADDVSAMFGEVLNEYGRVDFLINNAGIQIAAETHELAAERFDKVLAVNLRGASSWRSRRYVTSSTRTAPASSSTCRACIG